jgi:hypothetical protein
LQTAGTGRRKWSDQHYSNTKADQLITKRKRQKELQTKIPDKHKCKKFSTKYKKTKNNTTLKISLFMIK